MKRRNFLSAAAGSAAAIFSATTATVKGESSTLAETTAVPPAAKSPAKSIYRRSATVMLVIPREHFKPKSWRDVPSAEIHDGPEPFEAESYVVIRTLHNLSLAHARKLAKTLNQQTIRDGGEIAAWAIVAATDGRLVERSELGEDDPLATVYLVAIDDCHGRRYSNAMLDQKAAIEWAAGFNKLSRRGNIDARAMVLACDAHLQVAG